MKWGFPYLTFLAFFCQLPCLLVFLCGFSLFAGEVKNDKEEKKPSGEITVVGRKKYTSPTSILDFTTPSPLAKSPADILAVENSLRIVHYGAPGGYSFLMIRGSSPHQNDVYMDGIKLNDLYSGSFNMENLSLLMFHSAEIYRAYPAHLPDQNTGGAVNLVPYNAKIGLNERKEYNMIYKIHGDSHHSLGAEILLPREKGYHFAHVSGSQNRYEYVHDNGTPYYNKEDDYTKIRENEDFWKAEYAGSHTIKNTDSEWKFFGDGFYKEAGIPSAVDDQLAMRQEESRLLASIQNRYVLTPSALLVSQAGGSQNYSRTTDKNSSVYVGKMVEQRQGATGFWKESIVFLWNSHRLEPLVSYRKEILLFENDFGDYQMADSPHAGRDTLRASLQYAYIPDGLLQVMGGVSVHYSRDQEKNIVQEYSVAHPGKSENIFPGGNLEIRLFPGYILPWMFSEKTQDNLYLFSGIQSSGRIPTFAEKFGNGAYILPGDQLERETLIQGYGGVEGQIGQTWKWLDGARGRSEYYYKEINNYIEFIPNSQNTSRAINTDKAIIQGIENSLDLSIARRWKMDVKYTYTDARDKTKISAYHGKFLPQIPRHSFSSGLAVASGKWTWDIRYSYLGAVFRDRYNSAYYYIESKNILDTGLSWTPWKNHTATFAIHNLLNDQKKDILGYPVPGRYYSLGWKGEFSL